MQPFTREFIKKLPKTDLHLHLDGSIRIKTLIELAREAKVDLPSWTEEGLRETVFKITPDDPERIDRASKIMEEHLDVDAILGLLHG